jgi:type III secretory pathway component EscV
MYSSAMRHVIYATSWFRCTHKLRLHVRIALHQYCCTVLQHMHINIVIFQERATSVRCILQGVSEESYKLLDETDLPQKEEDIVRDCVRILNVDSDEVSSFVLITALSARIAVTVVFGERCSL